MSRCARAQDLQAEDGGQPYSRLLAEGGGEGPWETFVIKRADGQSGFIKSGDAVRLKSTGDTPYYVVAQLGEDHPEHILNVNSVNEGPWETGFASPATGEEHLKLKGEMRELLERLLAESPRSSAAQDNR